VSAEFARDWCSSFGPACAIAAADQEEVLNLASLDQLDDRGGIVKNGVAHEADGHRLPGTSSENPGISRAR